MVDMSEGGLGLWGFFETDLHEDRISKRMISAHGRKVPKKQRLIIAGGVVHSPKKRGPVLTGPLFNPRLVVSGIGKLRVLFEPDGQFR